MTTWSRSPGFLSLLIYITLLSVIKAQEVKVWPEVTGYLGQDVTLPCQFIPGPEEANVTQVQWSLLRPNGEEIIIIVSNVNFGITVHEPYAEEKVEIKELSLIIKDVNMTDEGSYSCSLSTFPSGSFEGTTRLVVKKQMALSAGVVAALVIAVMLLLVIIVATTYLTIVRRCDPSVNHIYIDTNAPAMDVARPSVIKSGVVYSEVKTKPSRDDAASSGYKRAKTVHAEDVTYSEVVLL